VDTASIRFLKGKPLGRRHIALCIITSGCLVINAALEAGCVGSKVGGRLGSYTCEMRCGGYAVPEVVVPAQILQYVL
jgi:hypothetical protein